MKELKDRYQSFTLLISDIYRNINRIKDKEMSEVGLKGAYVTVLFYLYHSDGIAASALAKASCEDKAAISRAVEFLQDNGYISVSEAGYRRPLLLTDKGRETAKRIADRIDEYVKSASCELSEEELEAMYKALNAIDGKLKG